MEYLSYLMAQDRVRGLREEAAAWRLAQSARPARQRRTRRRDERPEVTCRRAAARPATCGGL
jgi:hypothetical protein